MEIPLIDLKAQYREIKSEAEEAIRRVLESQRFILSDEVENLEGEVAGYLGVGYAAGVASGTDALVLGLAALGIGKGDIVITTPFSFFATAEAISRVGARPVFADIDKGTYNISPLELEDVLSRLQDDGVQAKAVIPVHLYGQCADMTRIMDIAERYGLKVIEDCAQAVGATHNGKKAGSFGDAAALSFFPSKNLGCFGDGGMVVSGDAELIERVKLLRVHGSRRQYVHEEVGYNSRLDSIQAAVLRVKLAKLDTWLDRRRAIAKVYDESFARRGIKTPAVAEGNTHTYHQYTVQAEKRDALLKFLNGKGIAARVYYPVPLHLQPCYRALGYAKGDFPISEKAAESVISLPVYPELSDGQVDYIVDAVREFAG